jgi:uncharacterized lipoprotein
MHVNVLDFIAPPISQILDDWADLGRALPHAGFGVSVSDRARHAVVNAVKRNSLISRDAPTPGLGILLRAAGAWWQEPLSADSGRTAAC